MARRPDLSTHLLLTLSLGLTTVGAEASNCPSSSTALLFDYVHNEAGEPGIGSGCPDSVMDRIILVLNEEGGFPTSGILDIREDVIDTEPEITIPMLAGNIPGRGVVYLSTHGHAAEPQVDNSGGELALEYYSELWAAVSAESTYLVNGTYYPNEIWVEQNPYGSYIIWGELALIENRLDAVAANAIVHLEASNSFLAADAWSTAGVVLGYDGSPEAVFACEHTYTFWSRLGCRDRSTLPIVGYAVEGLVDQVFQATLRVWGQQDTRLNCSDGCENQATLYTSMEAHERTTSDLTTIAFATYDEEKAKTHVVRGFASVEDYPTRGRALATVPAKGGRGARCRYYVEVPSGYLLYDVVAEGPSRQEAVSTPVAATVAPEKWFLEDDCHDRYKQSQWNGTGQIFRQVDGGAQRYEIVDGALRGVVPASGKLTSDDCDLCADYVIATSIYALDFVGPFEASLESQGLDVEVWYTISSADLEYFRAALAIVIDENATWNAGPGGATRSYPVNPGPTLGIVGDADPDYMLPIATTAASGSYIIVADMDNDSIPDCPVEVMPVQTVGESNRMASAAADVNAGLFVDPAKRVLLVAGDEYAGTTARYVEEFIADTDTLALVHHLSPNAPIVQSDFGSIGLQDSVRVQINNGIAEAWLYGRFTGANYWPANCVFYDSTSGVASFTRKQRIICWAPGCLIGAVDAPLEGDSGVVAAPIVEQFAFNDLSRSVLAGGVFGLDAGYEVDHVPWAVILREARMNALPSATVSRIHYDAVHAWYDQFPGNHYVLSTYALGSYVIPLDVATSVSDGTSSGAPATGLAAMPNVGSDHTFVFSLDLPVEALLRIVDASGRHVATVRSGPLAAGIHRYTWFGRDRAGRSVGAGVYFGVLTSSDGRRDVTKIVLVR